MIGSSATPPKTFYVIYTYLWSIFAYYPIWATGREICFNASSMPLDGAPIIVFTSVLEDGRTRKCSQKKAVFQPQACDLEK
jgi:hypothetical protein